MIKEIERLIRLEKEGMNWRDEMQFKEDLEKLIEKIFDRGEN